MRRYHRQEAERTGDQDGGAVRKSVPGIGERPDYFMRKGKLSYDGAWNDFWREKWEPPQPSQGYDKDTP